MSPASKSKSKKLSTRAAMERPKVSSKSLNLHANGGKSAPARSYNPALDTFHTSEISASAPSLVMQKNAQLRTIDESEDHCLSSGTTADYDSGSNNGSCSGDSEDHKDKVVTSAAPRSDAIPVPGSDAEKRDKIRQKNERKHQRQREKRAQELHMRCGRYLMSRKLEVLAQQLVAMGFSSDRATAALIVNEGCMEESVAWLLHEGEESKEHGMPNLAEDGGSHVKIDISDELSKIAALEMKFKCSKQEVERAVVACEGDLDKAEENLIAQKREHATAAGKPKVEDAGEHTSWNNKLEMSPGQNTMVRSQGKRGAFVSNQIPQQMDDREPADRNLLSLKTQQMPDCVRAQVASAAAVEKRWSDKSTNTPVSCQFGPALQFPVPSGTLDPQRHVFSSEVKTTVELGSLRDPFIMQHPQATVNVKPGSPPTRWYSNGRSATEILLSNANVGHDLKRTGASGSSSRQVYTTSQVQSFVSHPLGFTPARQGGSWNLMGNPSVTSLVSASSLHAPASLGLFSGWDSLRSSNTTSRISGSSNSVGWSSAGSLSQRDYSSIDWSLDLSQLRLSVKGDVQLSDTWPAMMMAGKSRASSVVNGDYITGLQDSGNFMVRPAASAASQEWTNPFAGEDLFGAPRRQFVAFPSL